MRVRKAVAVAGMAMVGIAGAMVVPSPAMAAGPGDLSVTTGPAILTPSAGGGYRGTMAVRIKSHGNTAGKSILVQLTEPLGLDPVFTAETGFGGCGLGYDDQGRRIDYCGLFTMLADNQSFNGVITFTALAAPANKTRITGPGEIAVSVYNETDPTPANNKAVFRGALTGTGHGVSPVVYTPATKSGLTLTAGASAVTWSANGDGSYTGLLPVTLSSATDAVTQGQVIRLIDPLAEIQYMSINPPDICFGVFCYGGAPLPQNTSRAYTLEIHASALPPAGSTIHAHTESVSRRDGSTPLAELTPADNDVIVSAG